MYGGIEAGGTKFVLGVGTGPDDVRARAVVPTTSPGETLSAVLGWFRSQPPIAALGIASFGPAQIDRGCADWGHILHTPKPGWSGADVAPRLGRELGVPVGFSTDVIGAALGEHRWGAARGCGVAVYVTIGTGIGAGAVVDGRPLIGLGHAEMGHAFPPLHAADEPFSGSCPFHGRCYEGLASGTAITARWGMALSELPADHLGHAMIAHYLGHFVVMVQALLAPHRIVIGGGVARTSGLLDQCRAQARAIGAGYFPGALNEVVVPPALGGDSGLVGAFCLAEAALQG